MVKVNYLFKTAPKAVYLLIVPVTLHIGDVSFDTYALLDNASEGTFIRQRVVDELGVKGEQSLCAVGTLVEKRRQ